MTHYNARTILASFNPSGYSYAPTVLSIMDDVIKWQCAQMNDEGLRNFYIETMIQYYSDAENTEEFNRDYKIYKEHTDNEYPEYLSAGS